VLIFFTFLLGFAVKVPMWRCILVAGRPRRSAHRRFVILAAITLKIGGYGFLRFACRSPGRLCGCWTG